jgi:hypothetical protein
VQFDLTAETEAFANSEACPKIYSLEEDEETGVEAEPELDLELDPFWHETFGGPDLAWESGVKAIRVQKIEVPTADQQRARIRSILGMLESETEEPSQQQVEESG